MKHADKAIIYTGKNVKPVENGWQLQEGCYKNKGKLTNTRRRMPSFG